MCQEPDEKCDRCGGPLGEGSITMWYSDGAAEVCSECIDDIQEDEDDDEGA